MTSIHLLALALAGLVTFGACTDLDDRMTDTSQAIGDCNGSCFDQDGDGVEMFDDCDDSRADRYQLLPCYVDADGDHYGTGTVADVCAGLTCADGVANRAESAGDCDDGAAAIHPHRTEIASDGVDNDCTGVPDEARSRFYVAGNGNTDSGFTIAVKLNSVADLAQVATKQGLWAKIHYRKLENASSPYTVTSTQAMSTTVVGQATYASIDLTGLEELKVYEVRLDFYNGFAGRRVVPASGCSGTSLTGCSNSDVYYTITKPAGADVPVKLARYNSVLNALHEYFHFRTTSMGSWDDTLRDRFELPARNEAYCSEFYATATAPFLVDMNPCLYVDAATTPQCDPAETSRAEDYVGDVRTWFEVYAASAADYHGAADMMARKPGDYLGVNPNDPHTNGQHSQMFLAWDADAQRYWLVEGNGSYTNAWGKLAHTVNVEAQDHCRSSYASDGWCPAEAVAECPSGCFYVKTIGMINNANMVD